jgi:hypothetical protein
MSLRVDAVGLGLGGTLVTDELLPCLVTLVNDLDSVLLGLGLSREGKDVLSSSAPTINTVSDTYLGLSIGDFVDSEPLVGSSDQTRKVPLDILNIVQSRSKGVIDINDKDLPVGLSLIEKSHDTENLDLLDLAGVTDGFSNLAYVERVVVTVGASLGVLDGRVFPSLGEGSVVPDVSWTSAVITHSNCTSVPWWGKQFRTNRSLPFLISTDQLGLEAR